MPWFEYSNYTYHSLDLYRICTIVEPSFQIEYVRSRDRSDCARSVYLFPQNRLASLHLWLRPIFFQEIDSSVWKHRVEYEFCEKPVSAHFKAGSTFHKTHALLYNLLIENRIHGNKLSQITDLCSDCEKKSVDHHFRWKWCKSENYERTKN